MTVYFSTSALKCPHILLATARVIIFAPSGRTTVARAILDTCSECIIISEHVTQILHLSKIQTAMTISGVNGTTTGRAVSTVQAKVKPINSDIAIDIHAFVLAVSGNDVSASRGIACESSIELRAAKLRQFPFF